MERRVNIWIRRALRRQVRELRFQVSIRPRLPFVLEDRPLASDHLTWLELVGVQGNAGVLDFSHWPALEDLEMEDCDVRSVEMHSPSVKRLRIRYSLFYTNYRTTMSFPSLVSFDFITNAGRVPLLESMPSLEVANVRFDRFYDDRCDNGRLDDCGNASCDGCYYYYGPDDCDCIFLEGLIEATDLELSAYPDMYVFNRDLEWCPTFSKLKTLVLGKWFVSADFSGLIWFLCHAPLLEKLTLNLSKVRNNLMKTEGSYKPLDQPIAASHLQVVEIICKDVDKIVFQTLKVLNANGIPKEKIRIQCSDVGRGEPFVSPLISSANAAPQPNPHRAPGAPPRGAPHHPERPSRLHHPVPSRRSAALQGATHRHRLLHIHPGPAPAPPPPPPPWRLRSSSASPTPRRTAAHLAPRFRHNLFFDAAPPAKRTLAASTAALRVRLYDDGPADRGGFPSRAVLALKRRSRIDAGVSRVEEVEEPLDPALALACADDPARLGGLDSPIVRLVADEYGVGGDAAPFVCLGGFRNTRAVYELEDEDGRGGGGLVLELDETRFDFGTSYELECETADPERVMEVLERLLTVAGVPYEYSRSNKFACFLD